MQLPRTNSHINSLKLYKFLAKTKQRATSACITKYPAVYVESIQQPANNQQLKSKITNKRTRHLTGSMKTLQVPFTGFQISSYSLLPSLKNKLIQNKKPKFKRTKNKSNRYENSQSLLLEKCENNEQMFTEYRFECLKKPADIYQNKTNEQFNKENLKEIGYAKLVKAKTNILRTKGNTIIPATFLKRSKQTGLDFSQSGVDCNETGTSIEMHSHGFDLNKNHKPSVVSRSLLRVEIHLPVQYDSTKENIDT